LCTVRAGSFGAVVCCWFAIAPVAGIPVCGMGWLPLAGCGRADVIGCGAPVLVTGALNDPMGALVEGVGACRVGTGGGLVCVAGCGGVAAIAVTLTVASASAASVEMIRFMARPSLVLFVLTKTVA
jgi:hypothetical protein